jgi:hypothetical protein
MGGCGSGHHRGRGLQSLEGYLALDLNVLLTKKTRQGGSNRNLIGLEVQWQSGSSCRVVIDLLKTDVIISSSAGRQVIKLSSANLTFGQRWFFQCDCGHRARKVYFRFGKFGCRDCRRLMFPSQAVSGNQYWLWRFIQKYCNAQQQ